MSSNLNIAAVGDISFEGRWSDTPGAHVFESVSHLLKACDLAVGNLEGPLFDGNNPVTVKTTLRGSTRWADVLSQTGFKVVSLANNHIMDHGKEGLFQTMEALEKAGIICFGAGNDPSVGEAAAKESYEQLKHIIDGDLVFITCGLGGGTGTGAAHIAAGIAKEKKSLTISVCTLPFRMEGPVRLENASKGLRKLYDSSDTLTNSLYHCCYLVLKSLYQ